MSAVLPDRLSALQNAVKRDPSSYMDEYRAQVRAFESELALLRLKLSTDSESFRALALFIAHCAPSFPDEVCALPEQLHTLLADHAGALAPEVRRAAAKSLVLLRSRGVIADPAPLLRLFFVLFRVRDRQLRELIFQHVVNDCVTLARGGVATSKAAARKRRRGAGAPSTAPAPAPSQVRASDIGIAMRSMQAFLYSTVADDSLVCARMSLQVLIELYKRGAWTDARTVNVIASTLCSKRVKLVVTALKFFLGVGANNGGDSDADADADSDEDEGGLLRAAAGSAIAPSKANVQEIEKNIAHVKKTRKRKRDAAKAFADIKRAQRKAASRGDGARPVFPAIALLHDPQGLGERLFTSLRSGALAREKFEARLLALNFVSRLVGQHRLMILPLYSFLGRYLAAHQTHVTHVLACVIQATHDGVPPEELAPTVRSVAHGFVSPGAKSELVQVGLNSLREIFTRCPALLAEPGMDALIGDLVAYKTFKGSKGVVAASRGILNLVREWFPALLARRDRGVAVAMDPMAAAARPAPFGALALATGVEGADLLALLLEDKQRRREKGDGGAVAVDDDEWARIDKEKAKKEIGGAAFPRGGGLRKRTRIDPKAEKPTDDAAEFLDLITGEDDDVGSEGEGEGEGEGGGGGVKRKTMKRKRKTLTRTRRRRRRRRRRK